MKKIVAINFGGIGDQILFLPLLENIKKKYPDAAITLIVEPRSKHVASLTNLVSKVLICDVKSGKNAFAKFIELFKLLKSDRFDAVVSYGSSPLIAVMLFLTGIRTRVGFANNSLSRLLLTNPVTLNKDQYAAHMFEELSKGFGLPNERSIPRISIPEESLKFAEEWLDSNTVKDKKTILIHPGSSKLSVIKGIPRFWAPEKWAALIKTLCSRNDLCVILAGGPDDEDVIIKINEKLGTLPNLINAFGQTKNLEQLGGLIKKVDLLVCIDSGPMHMAVGLGKKLVAIFGPTNEKRILPEDSRFRVVRNTGECSPCLFEKRLQVCDTVHCMNVEVNEVIKAINQML